MIQLILKTQVTQMLLTREHNQFRISYKGALPEIVTET
jgi:hypothetical protein